MQISREPTPGDPHLSNPDQSLKMSALGLRGDQVIVEAAKALAKLLDAVWKFEERFTSQRRGKICGD